MLLLLFWWVGLSAATEFDIEKAIAQFPADIVEKCNTASKISGMTEQEKQVVLLTNLARVSPAAFTTLIVNPYVDASEFYDHSNPYVISLRRDLQNTRGLEPYMVSKPLNHSAMDHAKYCGITGHEGHHDFTRRSNAVLKKLRHRLMGENCAYVRTEPIDFVMDLLIDDGVRSLGHRKSILDRTFQFTGVSIQPFKGGEFCLVQHFSAP